MSSRKKKKKSQTQSLRDVSVPAVMRRLVQNYMRPQFHLIFLGIICNLFVAGFTSLYPFLIQRSIDNIDATEIIWPFWVFPVGIVLLMGLRGTFIFLGGLSMSYAGHRMTIAIQKELFIHFVRADYEWITRHHSGRFLSIFMNDTGGISAALQASSVDLMRNLFTLLGILAYIAYLNPWLLLAILVVVPLAIAITGFFGFLTRKSQTVLMQEMGNFSMRVSEILKNLRTIKIYDGETTEIARMENIFENMNRHFARARKAALAPSSIIEILAGLSIATVITVIWFGEWEVGGMNDPGGLAGLLAAFILAYGALRRISGGYTSIEEGLACAIRVFAEMDRKAKIIDMKDVKPIGLNKTTIVFRDVHFRYGEATPALRGVSFQIPEGQSAALVGMSGGGKSTILNLIPRFYDPHQGAITIGGEDIRNIQLRLLRESIALVTQEPIIFDDSIRDNIRYARPHARDEEIEEAAKNAAAHNFIKNLPDGYDSKVGEGGIMLSGGERQRIALARAILKNAPILLMDEPTSSLDQESESHIQNALQYLTEERTTLIIAHRLSTIRHVDCIHVVHEGRVIEKGSHDELIHMRGAYAKLYGTADDEIAQ